MLWVWFVTTIQAFEREKTIHALDRAATVIGYLKLYITFISVFRTKRQQVFQEFDLLSISL
jgi:hypothetical protein